MAAKIVASESALQQLMERPLQLIEPNKDGEMELNSKTADLLRALDTPVVVIGIVGIYRAGKSYLMNLLAEEKTGFDLGSTVVGKTKGIWIWCKPHPILPDTTLMLMDTEGLEDVDTGSTNRDMKIIILTLLLSSTMIYNASQKLDNTLIRNLEFVIEASKHIQVQSGQLENRDADFDIYFPTLVVTIRDFYLQLQRNNEKLTAQEYFEYCLKLQCDEDGNEIISKFNEPRIKILKYFPQNKRFCFVLPKPVKNYGEEALAMLEELPEEELNPDFIKKCKTYKEFIIDKSEVKRFPKCRCVTGRMFIDIAEEYVTAFLTGQMPCIESVFKLAAGQENNRILDDCLREYAIEIEQLELPEKEDILIAMHSTLVTEIIKKYQMKIIFEDVMDMNTEFQKRIEDIYENILSINREIWMAENERLLSEFFVDIDEKFHRDAYFKPDGYKEYMKDLNDCTQSFRAICINSSISDLALQKFLDSKEATRNLVIEMDMKLTEAQIREETEEKLRKEQELQLELLQKQSEEAREREESLRSAFEVNISSLMKEFDQQNEEQQTRFQNILRERDNTNERIARQMSRDVTDLRQQVEAARRQGQSRRSPCVIA